MFKVQFGVLCDLHRDAAYRGHPYVVVKDAIVETTTLGAMIGRLRLNRHVKDVSPIAFNSLFYGCPAEMQATE